MRILFLAGAPPSFGVRGDSVRIATLVRLLASRHEVTLVCIRSHGQSAVGSWLEPWCDICKAVYDIRVSRLEMVICGLLNYDRPLTMAARTSPRINEFLRRLTHNESYDLVIASPLSVAGHLWSCRVSYRVADLTDLVSRMWSRMVGYRRSVLSRAWVRFESRRLRRWEVKIVRDADLVLLASDLEAEELVRAVPGARVAVVPNCVDTEKLLPLPDSQSRCIAFWGNFRYPPNVDGVLWFTREVMPIIQRYVPDCSFQVIGPHPPPEIVAMSNMPWVRIVGGVEDIRPYVTRSSVVVAPILYGSGTRLKILEALAMGRAVVCTPEACEGLDLRPGIDIEIATSAEEFGVKVAALLLDPVRRNQLASNGRCRVVKKYSLNVAASCLDYALERLFNNLDT